MTVTCKNDYRDLKIYVNGLLHLHMLKKEYLMFQSYLIGSNNSKSYYIEIYCSNQKMNLEYDNKKLWKKILLLLDENL